MFLLVCVFAQWCLTFVTPRSQPPYVYLWNHTHCSDDITHIVFMTKGPTIFLEVYALYMTWPPRFMTSQHSIQIISLLYLISNWIYLTTHPLHLCIHTQIIDHITPIVCMITQHNMHDIMWIHMTSHPLFMISHHAMTCTYTVFMSSHPGYLSSHPR